MDQDISRRSEPSFDLPPNFQQPLPDPEMDPNRGMTSEGSGRRLPESEIIVEKPLRASAATNGNGAKPKEPTSLFWQQPIAADEEVNWFVPPLPRREEQSDHVVGMLGELSTMMPHLPMRSWLTRWNYHTRSAAAAAEQVDVEREAERRFAEQCTRAEVDGRKLDELIQAQEAREQAVESELNSAQKEFAEAAARAGLSCEPTPKFAPSPGEKNRTAADRSIVTASGKAKPAATTPDPIADLNWAPSGISPQSVEDALQNEVPDLDAVAGEHGVSPVPRYTLWNTILTFFMQFLAPLVCGFMLALCLGTLVGILDLDDFSRRDSLPKFVLAAALGFVIVYLMGEVFSNAVHALTRALEMREEEAREDRATDPISEDGASYYSREPAVSGGTFRRPATPRLQYGMGIAVGLIGAALFLGFAEVIAEGNGIRELHHQQIARRMRFRNPNSMLPPEEELNMILYLIIGTLVSGPYLLYKTSKAWGESDIQLREAWLLHQQRTWIDQRRARPETGHAFQIASRVEQLENSLYDIKIQLKTLRERRAELYNPQPDQNTQVRRKEARAAAVGEALRLQTMIEEMVNVTEPFPTAPPAVTARAGRETAQPPSRTIFTRP